MLWIRIQYINHLYVYILIDLMPILQLVCLFSKKSDFFLQNVNVVSDIHAQNHQSWVGVLPYLGMVGRFRGDVLHFRVFNPIGSLFYATSRSN